MSLNKFYLRVPAGYEPAPIELRAPTIKGYNEGPGAYFYLLLPVNGGRPYRGAGMLQENAIMTLREGRMKILD